MTRDEAVQFIQDSSGKIFSIRFTKRTDGTTRLMNCRTGVVSHLKGGSPAYNAKEKGLMTVFDMSKMGFRSIPIEGITEIKVRGEWNPVS